MFLRRRNIWKCNCTGHGSGRLPRTYTTLPVRLSIYLTRVHNMTCPRSEDSESGLLYYGRLERLQRPYVPNTYLILYYTCEHENVARTTTRARLRHHVRFRSYRIPCARDDLRHKIIRRCPTSGRRGISPRTKIKSRSIHTFVISCRLFPQIIRGAPWRDASGTKCTSRSTELCCFCTWVLLLILFSFTLELFTTVYFFLVGVWFLLWFRGILC